MKPPSQGRGSCPVAFIILCLVASICSGREFLCLTVTDVGSELGGVEYSGNDWDQVPVIQGIPFLKLLAPPIRYDCPGSDDSAHPTYPELRLSSQYVQTYSQLHVLQHLGLALDVPDGLVAGCLLVHYEGGSESSLPLIVGLNTAEWAYDRDDWQECLLHSKVTPATSWISRDSEGQFFPGHSFYSTLELDSTRRVVSVDFQLSDEACRPRPQCGEGDLTTWFRVRLVAITLER